MVNSGLCFREMPSFLKFRFNSKTLLKPPTSKRLRLSSGAMRRKKLKRERLVMGSERFGGRAARHGLQHWRFHFQKALRLHEPPDLAHDHDPFLEHGARML